MLFLYCGKCKDYNDSLQKIIILRNVFDCNAWSPVLSSTEILLCTFCRKFYKGGGGGSAVLQVLVRIFEKMLKVLQMLQFIQK